MWKTFVSKQQREVRLCKRHGEREEQHDEADAIAKPAHMYPRPESFRGAEHPFLQIMEPRFPDDGDRHNGQELWQAEDQKSRQRSLRGYR